MDGGFYSYHFRKKTIFQISTISLRQTDTQTLA